MRGSAARLLVPGLGALALVALVAVAATGSTPTGTADGRKPSDVLLDTFFSLGLVLLLPAAGVLVYGLLKRKEIAREIASGRYPRGSVLGYLVLVALFTAAAYFRLRGSGPLFGGEEPGGVLGPEHAVSPPNTGAADTSAYQAEFAWIPVLVLAGLGAVGVLAYVLAGRRRDAVRGREDVAVAEHLAGEIEDTLDDLRAEPDPRRAVVAAYARLERSLTASGLPRRRADTALEYLARILDRLEVEEAAVRRLTDLYTRAKFSQHGIDEAAREDAIAALVAVRDGLRRTAHLRAGARAVQTAPGEASS